MGEDVAGREDEGAAEDRGERPPDRFERSVEGAPERELLAHRDGDRRESQRRGQDGSPLPADCGGKEEDGGDREPSQQLQPEMAAAEPERLRLPADGAEAECQPAEGDGRDGTGGPLEEHAAPLERDDEDGDYGQPDHGRNAT